MIFNNKKLLEISMFGLTAAGILCFAFLSFPVSLAIGGLLFAGMMAITTHYYNEYQRLD